MGGERRQAAQDTSFHCAMTVAGFRFNRGDHMKFISGERQLLVSNNGALLLTSRRVRYDSRRWGQSRLVSIALESVASCGLVTRDQSAAFWVVLLVYFLRNSLQLTTPEFTVICTVAVIVYFAGRSAVLEIRSTGGERIAVSARELPREEAVSFIDALEAAKLGAPGRGEGP